MSSGKTAEEDERLHATSTGEDKRTITAHFRRFVKRDPWFLLHKSVYTIYCASIVFYLPMLAVYAKGLGLNKSQIGILNAIPPLCELVFTPIWTWAADHGEEYRRSVMVGNLLLSTFLRCLTGFISAGPNAFGILCAWTLLTEAVATPVMAVLDASAFAVLDATTGTKNYGWLRAWGAVGWGVAAPFMGQLVDSHGIATIFPGLALLTAPAALLMLYLPQERRRAGGSSARAAWGKLLTADVLLFFAVCFIMGVLGAGVIGGLLFQWLLELGASNTLLGVSLLVTCVSEVPMFFVSAPLLERFGHVPVLFVSLVAYALRLLYYSVLTDPWWTLPAELLHGATYALAWASATKYAFEEFPPEMSSTAQGLLASVQWGLGGGLGAILGGGLYQAYGAVVMFRVSSLLAIVGLGLLWLQLRLRRLKRAEVAASAIDGVLSGAGASDASELELERDSEKLRS